MYLNTLIKGFKNGFGTLWNLAKIIFPVTLIIKALGYTPLISWMIDAIAPFMRLFGLSGDAAIVLVMGNLISSYAGIAAIYTLKLTIKEVFILAVMLSFSHDIIIESAIVRKFGVKASIMGVFRLVSAFLFAFLINICWPGGEQIAKYGISSATSGTGVQIANGWMAILWDGVYSGLNLIFQIGIIIVPILVVIQILKDINAVDFLSGLLRPVTRFLGISDKASFALLAGVIFGITYGAGVLIQTAREENLTKKDLYLVAIFLGISHSVIEDTLIFIPFGINVFALLIFRMAISIMLTFITSRVWGRIVAYKKITSGEKNI